MILPPSLDGLVTRERPGAGAIFSQDERYRYLLWRTLEPAAEMREIGPGLVEFRYPFPPFRTCMFLMLNPSTADETKLDPTVTRCAAFARAWGFTTMVVANIFALRSTDPKALYAAENPIGPLNDAVIKLNAASADLVVAAWGTHGFLLNRGAIVRDDLEDAGIRLQCLGLTKRHGEPLHPLYLKATTALRPLEAP